MSEDQPVYNIAVDARPLSTPTSGVARVISRVITHMPEPERFRFFLYSHQAYHPDFEYLLRLPNVVWLQGKGITAKKGGIWFNLTLPFLIRKNNIALFWGSQQVIPPFLPASLPVVLTYYDLVLYLFPKAMRAMARIQQRLVQSFSVKGADRILSISAQTQKDMIKKFDYPEEQARVSLLGYDPPARKTGVKVELDFKSPFILSVSTLEPRKNYKVLLDAYMGYLKQEQAAPYHLVIVGRRGWESRKFFEELDQMIAETGKIHVLDNVNDDELYNLYSRCAFFCLSTLYEGFGLTLLEGLSAGKFALASDIGSLREIGGDLIPYIDPLDVPAWKKAISETVELHRSKELKIGPFPVEEWGWDRTARIHFKAFLELLTS